MIAEPRFVKEGWLDDSKPYEGWKLKENAPEWAKEEFENVMKSSMEFRELVDDEPGEDKRTRIY